MNHLIATYGYWAVFALVAAECLGVPLPGESIVIAAGIYSGDTHRMRVWVIFFVAATAATIGGQAGFWIGEKGGYRLLRRYGHYVWVDEPKIKIGRYIFDKYGGLVVFFGRFVAVLRTYAAFLAGTNRMRRHHFMFFNAAGAIVWAGVYSFGSYALGSTVRRDSTTVSVVLGVIAVVAVITGVLVLRRHANRLSAVAEQAYPGPLTD